MGFFKKEVNEPPELQLKDVLKYPKDFADLLLSGESCDEVTGARGEFGSLENPIPVNGALGEIKYLGKLRGKSGAALFFHRVGSAQSPATSHSVDVFEVVGLDGTQWNTLYFDMYHPRRSNKAPLNYSLVPYDKKFGKDIPFGYGVTSLVEDFPYGLPSAIQKAYGDEDGVFARHAREWLQKSEFVKPTDSKPRKKRTTNWELAGSFQTEFPHTFNALQKLIMAMAEYQKNRNKKALLGRDKGLDSYKKFEASLRDTLLSMVMDDVVPRDVPPNECREVVIELIAAFAEVFPNWPDAYSFANEYFVNDAKVAEDRIRHLLAQ